MLDLVDNSWSVLGEEVIEYNWKYRSKICSKCPLSEQKRRSCVRFDNYRMIKGVEIQESHCNKLENARANKFRNRMKSLLRLTDSNFSGRLFNK